MVYYGLVSKETGLFYYNFGRETKNRGMIMGMNSDTERMRRRIAALKEAYPNYRGILEFFEKLLLEQLKTMAKVEYHPPGISEDRARIRAKEGFPMFSKVPRYPKWKWKTRVMMCLNDWFKVSSFVHVKFQSNNDD